MSFKENYPELFQFFAGYFPDADLEGLTDEEVVTNYITDCKKSEKSKKELEQSRRELEALMNDIESYWKEVSVESNRHFESPLVALEWLDTIKQKLNE